jgi:outer membrane cobalamin receptor
MTAADLLARQVPEIAVFGTVDGRRFPTGLGFRGRGTFGNGEPLVVLDGVRFSGGVGQAMDRLRQVAATDVKAIRILRGPSSAFLYGSPHGVIYLQTHAGPPIP